jgi:hypothetical protein
MDEKVFRFVAHIGFTHFEKGIPWPERMYVCPCFTSAILIPLKHAHPSLTATNFWERVSLMRAFYLILF